MYLRRTSYTIGSRYRKAVYRAYTDATFSTRVPTPAYYGTMGPMIIAEVRAPHGELDMHVGVCACACLCLCEKRFVCLERSVLLLNYLCACVCVCAYICGARCRWATALWSTSRTP